MAVWALGADYRHLEREIEELESECMYLIHKPGTTDRVIETEKVLKKKAERLKQQRLDIESTIENLQPHERRLIRMRYVRGFTWQQIAQRLYCDESTARRWHRGIINNLQ